jgi:hypothetical protein
MVSGYEPVMMKESSLILSNSVDLNILSMQLCDEMITFIALRGKLLGYDGNNFLFHFLF